MTTDQKLTSPSLREIIQYELPSLFRRHHLKRKLKIGLVGLPGEGKSISGATIALLDHMVEGEPCWSNMQIKCKFKIGDDIAGKYGLQSGLIEFEASKLEKLKLLRLDPEYRGGLIFLDEINMEFAEAMRSSSNVNLYFDRVDQQLRKDDNGLIYTVIHEMWVDPRVRNMTDIFIRCEDTALSPEGLSLKKEEGVSIKWIIYPMTRLLTGESYYQTNQPLPPVYFNAKKFWGIFDTREKQAEGEYKYSVDLTEKKKVDVETAKNQFVVGEYSEWAWLYDKIKYLHDEGVEELTAKEMWEYLEPNPYGHAKLGEQLSKMGIIKKGDGSRRRPYTYIIPIYDLDKPPSKKVLQPAGVREG